jgi:CubicO group peptidase (beta-lactamase class C family)
VREPTGLGFQGSTPGLTQEVPAVSDSTSTADPAVSVLDGGRLDEAAVAAVERRASAFFDGGVAPGVAYGVVAGGELVHAGGRGERWLSGPVPDAGSVFRIASMTKSFTAATILLLRDQGALALDDRAEDYVSEVSGIAPASADSPRLTLRHLLTMTGGFPTDDPWGDRQQGLAPDEFAALLRDGGVRVAWAPGTRFEYSNLGYAILGRVIEAVTGERYADAVRARLLAPLGMDRTGYEATEFDPAEVARGYQRASGWAELAPDPYGAFAPMGGVFSTVADLARWVAGFAAAFPARDGQAGADPHPLSRATRREMQLAQVAITGNLGGSFPDVLSASYGFGLFIEEDPAAGTVVQHSGGYPGYGSQMRWHPATGLGVIVLGNGTYTPAGRLAGAILGELVPRCGVAAGARRTTTGALVRGPVPGDGEPWPQTLAARAEVDELLQDWDDERADKIFAPNVAWDQPYAARHVQLGRVRERIGSFAPDPDRAPEYDSPASCRWWLRGERGCVQVDIGLAPLTQPQVQSLRLAVPPAPGSVLLRVLDSVIGLINDDPVQWPDWLPVTAGVDTPTLLRRLRVGSAWAGRCAVTAYRAGDGQAATTAELTGPAGRLALEIAVDAPSEALRQAGVTLLP